MTAPNSKKARSLEKSTAIPALPVRSSRVGFTPELAIEYERLFASCVIRRDKTAAVADVCEKIVANRARYEAVGASLGIPWYFIGAVHNLEASLSFKTHLHNGDPLTARTVQIPKGRPLNGQPPFSWEESAIDALKLKGLHEWREWSLAGLLFQLERYNGFGYRLYHPEVLSPYLWSFSDHYTKGKYADDGKWDANLVSRQCGAVTIIKHLVDSAKITLPKPSGNSIRSLMAPDRPAPPAEAPRTTEQKIGRRLDAFPDRVDVRDWFYQPTLAALPGQLVNIGSVPTILDQGNEGACTGFALAAVINFLLAAHGVRKPASSRMLYEMARRYDEWPGEEYEGSSARGAMKGWIAHGVCLDNTWPKDLRGAQHLTTEVSREARGIPGGAYYRVEHRAIRDMHAALAETGILYITLMVHSGWENPGVHPGRPQAKRVTVRVVDGKGTRKKIYRLPVIQRHGAADGGHAVAIVGYTDQGFIIQNSWGKGWGSGGFALLPYEDYLLHAVDVWVAQLGVPINLDSWQAGAETEAAIGIQRAADAVPADEIRPYIINLGNNGKLSDSGVYFTKPENIHRLFSEDIPKATSGWKKRRILLYLHGGLNSESDAGRRALSFRDVCLENEIYPLHLIWETGEKETIWSIVGDLFTRDDNLAGGMADWWRKAREALVEAKDMTLELTASLPGTLMWDEMKENARQASIHPEGGMRILASMAREALSLLAPAEAASYELHVVGHSAGSIFAGYALDHLLLAGLPLVTLQFMAPAITIELFAEKILPRITAGKCPVPVIFNLSDEAERDDTCWKYGKSLLYLVSNAFEHRRGRPLLGMDRFVRQDPDLVRLFKLSDATAGDLPSYVLAKQSEAAGCRSQSVSHGGFDSDPDTLNSLLFRILGGQTPGRQFTKRDFEGT